MAPFLALVPGPQVYNFVQADDYTLFDGHPSLRSGLLGGLYRLSVLISYCYINIGFIFNSGFSHARFLERSHRRTIPPLIVNPGLDHEVFHPGAGQGRDGTVRIGFMARPQPGKGLPDFMAAIGLMTEQLRNRIAVTVMALGPLDVPPPCLRWTVVRPGGDRAIASILAGSDIFVSSSRSEGFGLPALEAMACGCAVVTSDNGGCREYARHQANCLMYPPGDSAQLARCIGRLVDDAGLRRRLSAGGIRTASAFTWQRSRGQLLRALGRA
jgi:glycosyltransferase involved in cell wall biosynthesis